MNQRFVGVSALTVLFFTVGALSAFGQITMSATYYTIAETDHDMNFFPSPTVFSNEVQNTLGPDGLPVLNTPAYGCTSGCYPGTVPGDLTASGEITWWSPGLNKGGAGGVSDVIETGTGTITLPYSNATFFPPNGTGPNDLSGFQAAVFSTTLVVPSPETISFNFGADDVAFVYLDGSIVCDLGGAHPNTPGTCTSSSLTAGNHTLELFYADIRTTHAELTFSVTTAGIAGSPTPPSLLVDYAANLNSGDSFVNITNDGASDPVNTPGTLCVNIYAFDPSEEMLSCCTCPVTPNGLVSLSVLNSLRSNTLTGEKPSSMVIELIATTNTGATCDASNVSLAQLGPGLRAWGTTPHALPGGGFGMTENSFSPGILSPAELTHVTSFCGFLETDGTGQGFCGGCPAGGL
jgi:fibro-slime domain-containing protein